MRIIIKNNSKLNDIECLGIIQEVMEKGKISNDGKCYSYVTFFLIPIITVYCEETKTGFKFTIN